MWVLLCSVVEVISVTVGVIEVGAMVVSVTDTVVAAVLAATVSVTDVAVDTVLSAKVSVAGGMITEVLIGNEVAVVGTEADSVSSVVLEDVSWVVVWVRDECVALWVLLGVL